MSDSDTVIRVENLSKRYLVGHNAPTERYTSLRDTIVRHGKSFARKTLDMARGRQIIQGDTVEAFWALKDVSFEVKRGEVLGIIGRNGAGKSTLLKILSRITEPTEGRITLNGRVASLLEVGTGFHPELSGRENILLNGAILGMTKAEIQGKFDEIVAFAEVEKFLDTPVKRYSSGMYVRLAFAVAAHLEPDILVVDEVLAVGDVEFQKKCLGKMQEVSHGGRTVLFVSHQMAAVQNLCQRGILMSSGHVVDQGPVDCIIKSYLSQTHHLAQSSFSHRKDRQGNGVLRFNEVTIVDADRKEVAALDCGGAGYVMLRMTNTNPAPLKSVRVAVGVDNEFGQRITVWSTHLSVGDLPELNPGVECVEIHLPRLTLAPGRYGFTLYCSVNGEVADWIKNAGSFDVEAGDFFGTGQLPEPGQGCFLMDHSIEARASV